MFVPILLGLGVVGLVLFTRETKPQSQAPPTPLPFPAPIPTPTPPLPIQRRTFRINPSNPSGVIQGSINDLVIIEGLPQGYMVSSIPADSVLPKDRNFPPNQFQIIGPGITTISWQNLVGDLLKEPFRTVTIYHQ